MTFFRKESMQRISSPEKLDEYLRVLNPSVWVMLTALIGLIVVFFIWGFTGTIHDVCSTNGVRSADTLTCYVEPQYGMEIRTGMHVIVNGDSSGVVVNVEKEPVTRSEAEKEIGNAFHSATLDLHDWNTRVDIAADGTDSANEVQTAEIVVSEFRPIEFLMGRQA